MIKREGNKITIGRVKISAERWPWQTRHEDWLSKAMPGAKYGWFNIDGWGRFGGGWTYCLGLRCSSTGVNFELLFGFVKISWYKPKEESK